MSGPLSGIGSAGLSLPSAELGGASAAQPGHLTSVSALSDGHEEFLAALNDGGVDEDSWAVSPSRGIMDMVRAVDAGQRDMQSKLLTSSVAPTPENLHAASVALSKYDLQTLFLSKVANKAFQAVDRLTNLQ